MYSQGVEVIDAQIGISTGKGLSRGRGLDGADADGYMRGVEGSARVCGGTARQEIVISVHGFYGYVISWLKWGHVAQPCFCHSCVLYLLLGHPACVAAHGEFVMGVKG